MNIKKIIKRIKSTINKGDDDAFFSVHFKSDFLPTSPIIIFIIYISIFSNLDSKLYGLSLDLPE